MCGEGKGSKCLALSCSAGIRLGPVFYSYITPGVKSELGQVTQVVFSV